MAFCASGDRFRILEIELRHAIFDTKELGKTYYVRLWIHPSRKLQSRAERSIGAKPFCVWDSEKFVFSIPEDFLAEENDTSIWFQVYKARKHLPDTLVGSAECDLRWLFRDAVALGKNESIDELVDDPRYGNMFQADEFDDGARNWNSCDQGGILAIEPKAAACLELSRGSDSKGTLGMLATVWKGCINGTAGQYSKWPNMAMNYSEFMGFQLKEEKRKETNKQSCTCFAGGIHRVSATT